MNLQIPTVARCIERAEQETGLGDWGPGIFRDILELLTRDVRAAAPIPQGIRAYDERVSRILRNRLRLVEDRKRDPLISGQVVAAPLFVIGLPRTGTTFLHSLLAQDPASRSPAEWEAMRPSPPPRTETYDCDARIGMSEGESRQDPESLKRHIQGARLPIECGPAGLTYEFLSSGFDIRWRTPRHRERMKDDVTTAYQWHKKVLQHLQSHTIQSHWVLKSPEHIGHLPELFDTYPDARIVFIHRAPEEVFPSLASLTAHMQEENLGAQDHREIGPEVLEMWRSQLFAGLAFRASQPVGAAIFDATHGEISADPIAVVERIYDHFSMPLSAAARSGMNRWLGDYGLDRYRERHGTHLYTASEYGLDPAELAAGFRDYVEQFVAPGQGA